MAHLTIQIGASIVIPVPTRLSRSGGRPRRIVAARLRWQAIQEAAVLDKHFDRVARAAALRRRDYWDGAVRRDSLLKKGKPS